MSAAHGIIDRAAEQEERQEQHMLASLRLLNDTLAATPMAGRYWMFAGLVLGWAREGRLLRHDCKDADFAYLGDDAELLEASFPILAAAGFEPLYRFPSLDGPATEYCLQREGLRFDFFRLELEGDRFRYYNYGYAGPGWTNPAANECAIPAQPLEEIRYLGRTWLKARDHDVELTGLYGDWRTPDKGWNYMNAPSVVAQRPWDDSSHRWHG